MKTASVARALALTLALTFVTATATNAKTVWRCGEGGRSYSETPCPGGQPVTVADKRTEAQAQAARDEVKRSQDLASRMKKERLEDEQRNLAANARAGNVGPTRAAAKPAEKTRVKLKPKPRPGQANPADDSTWRATAPPSRRKKD